MVKFGQVWAVAISLIGLNSIVELSAFSTTSLQVGDSTRRANYMGKSCHPPTALRMSGVFDDFLNSLSRFLDGEKQGAPDSNEGFAEGDDALVSIPVTSIKPGGLRCFLMFYLMGIQNTPDRMTWKADQPTREEFVIDLFFHDNTAMLTVELLESRVSIRRTGPNPSTAFLMQEAVVLQGILDELHECAFDENIPEENRLLILPEPGDAIEIARNSLAFG